MRRRSPPAGPRLRHSPAGSFGWRADATTSTLTRLGILTDVAFADLQDFVAALERDGDLTRVRVPVDPHLEVTGIVQRVLAEQGPALLFERPTRGRLPLLMNAFGTQRRMARALGVESLDEIGQRIGELIKPELPKGVGGLKDALGKVGQLRSAPPRKVKAASCQEVIVKGDDIDLVELLPGIKAWPEDGGVFL